MQTTYFYSGVGGFFAGVAGVLIGLPGWPFAALCTILAAAVTVLLIRWDTRQVFAIALIVGLLATAAGAVRTSVTDRASGLYAFAPAVSKSVSATGTVVSRPTQTDSGQNFNIRFKTVRVDDTGRTIAGPAKAVVYAGKFPRVTYGDVIRLNGRLVKPKAFTGTGGREFYYPQYLARKDIFYELYRPQIVQIEDEKQGGIQQSLANLRRRLLGEIHKHIPDPHAALTGGVLLGAENALGGKLQQDFRRTSLIHIVVLSGFNVMIVATVIGKSLLALGLPVIVSAGAASIGILLFALLVGLTPTVIRASIMAIFALLARVSGRRYAAGRGLSIAAVGMVLVTPEILFFDPSFQLSAIATAGLVGFGDTVDSWLSWLPERFGLREAATATISAQIAVLPLLLYYTGTLSLVSLPANLLVLPMVPVLMGFGVLTILFGFFWSTLALLGASGVYVVAEYIFWVVKQLSSLSFATVSVPVFPVWWVLLGYVCLWVIMYRLQSSESTVGALPNPET